MADRRMRGRLGALAMVGSSFLLFDCGSPAPSPSRATVTLTIRVAQRGNESAIAGALVRVNGAEIGRTSSVGNIYFGAVPGAALRVDVSADGFVGFGADGAIANAETWTFYLERGTGEQP